MHDSKNVIATYTVPLEVPEKDRSSTIWLGFIVILLVSVYWAISKALIQQWWLDPDYGHGFFVPLVSGYVLWRRRRLWQTAQIKPLNFGFVIMLGAVALLLVGSLGAELFTARFSLLVLLAGMILFLGGQKLLQAVSFPLCFLIFMIPLPVIIYNQITFPLQLVASRLATSWLDMVRVPVLRDGNILVLSNYSLEVVEACSGIRSLMSLIALAVAYGYLVEPSRWIRYGLVFLTIPAAVITNALRIAIAGILAHRFGPTAAEGFLHEFSGWIIFVVALGLIFSFHRILRTVAELRERAIHA